MFCWIYLSFEEKKRHDMLYCRSSAAETSQPQKKQEKEVKNQKEREKKEKDAIKKFKVRKKAFSRVSGDKSNVG